MLAQQIVDEGLGIAVHQDLREGDPLQELRQQALAAELLAVGARGSHALRELALRHPGGPALAPRRTAAALLVVRNEPAADYGQVLVPVDFSASSREGVRAAQRFAPGATLHLVHAFELPEEGELRTAGVSDEAVAAHRARARDEAQAAMDALRAELGSAARVTATRVPGRHPDA